MFLLKQKPISTPDIYISGDDEATVVEGAATTSVVAEAAEAIVVEDVVPVVEDAAPYIENAKVGAEGATLTSDQIEAQVQPPQTEKYYVRCCIRTKWSTGSTASVGVVATDQT